VLAKILLVRVANGLLYPPPLSPFFLNSIFSVRNRAEKIPYYSGGLGAAAPNAFNFDKPF
jgi:hypothetical protein